MPYVFVGWNVSMPDRVNERSCLSLVEIVLDGCLVSFYVKRNWLTIFCCRGVPVFVIGGHASLKQYDRVASRHCTGRRGRECASENISAFLHCD